MSASLPPDVQHPARARPTVLALDLEGTLISNGVSQFPRPGLIPFLTAVRTLFPRLVLFTSVSPARVREIQLGLVSRAEAPAWFAALRLVEWSGSVKDLRAVPETEVSQVLLVDDMPHLVLQTEQLVAIPPWTSPYPDDDRALAAVLATLRARLDQPA